MAPPPSTAPILLTGFHGVSHADLGWWGGWGRARISYCKLHRPQGVYSSQPSTPKCTQRRIALGMLCSCLGVLGALGASGALDLLIVLVVFAVLVVLVVLSVLCALGVLGVLCVLVVLGVLWGIGCAGRAGCAGCFWCVLRTVLGCAGVCCGVPWCAGCAGCAGVCWGVMGCDGV